MIETIRLITHYSLRVMSYTLITLSSNESIPNKTTTLSLAYALRESNESITYIYSLSRIDGLLEADERFHLRQPLGALASAKPPPSGPEMKEKEKA